MDYIRDLKGYKTIDGKTIKDNCLFRSSQIYKPNEKQLAYLNSINIKRIIDLRNEQEAIDEPDIKFENVKYMNISLIDNNLNGVVHVKNKKEQFKQARKLPTMIDTYEAMLSDDYSTNAIKKVIREIVLIDDYPTIIHCVTGKDRAGIITAIILKILGVDQETIVSDYIKQRKIYFKKATLYFVAIIVLSLDIKLAKKIFDYYAIKEDYINKAFETIDKRYGSFDSFIHNFIGLNDKDIEMFKARVLI